MCQNLPRKKWSIKIVCCLSFILSSTLLFSQAPTVSFIPVITTGLTTPLDIVNAGDGSNRLFVAQKDGRIRYLKGNILIDTIFLDISNRISTSGERGLLSLAFHPQYASNGYFFVYYTDLAGSITVARYHVSADPNRADPSSGQVLLTIGHSEFDNHNGGKLNFGSDGYLYFTTGDGGGGGDPHFNAQNKDTLLGKMIRIDVNGFATQPPYYSIPPGNPYIGPGDNMKDEIWASGLRNTFRWSFDRVTHDMWIGDVGQGAREEVDFLAAGTGAGTNFGWRCYEGMIAYNDSGCLASSNYLFPIFDYNHTQATGGFSITGGMVYRGAAFPGLYGSYICIDYVSGNGWIIQPNGTGWNAQRQGGLPTGIVGFGEDEQGELYAVSLNGPVYRVTQAGVLPAKLESFQVNQQNGLYEFRWQTASEQNLKQFEVQSGSDGIRFSTIGLVAATNTNSRHLYQFSQPAGTSQEVFFRLKMINNNGAAEYSDIVRLESTPEAVLITPTLVQHNTVNIQLKKPFNTLQVIDMNGRTVIVKNLQQRIGTISLDVSGLSKGVYTLKFSNQGAPVFRKMVKP